MVDQRYCVECGKLLSPGDKFCPACGATIREEEYWGEVPEGAVVSTACVEDRSGTLKNVTVLTFIWVAVALLMAISMFYCLGMIDTITEQTITQLKESGAYEGYPSMWDYMVANGIDEESLKDMFWMVFMALGVTLLFSAAFAAVSGYLDVKRQHYTASMVCLVLSIVFSFSGFICLIVGIIVAVYLGKCKCEFES